LSDFADLKGPTSPWAFLQETRSYAARALNFIDTARPTSLPDFLRVHIGSVIPAQTRTASPVRRGNDAQYVNGNSLVHIQLIRLAWFTYAKGIHGCLHRPTFESNALTPFASNETPPLEVALYHAVLALGACLLGERDRSYQYLKSSWTIMMHRMYESQDLKAVQATYLLVCHLV
jgi:hypothetical protein